MAGLLRGEACWVLPVRGEPVTRLGLEVAALTLLLANGFEVRVEETLAVRAPDGTTTEVDPGDADVSALLPLRRATVVSAVAHDDGRLELVLAGGGAVTVAASAEYEAWTLSGPDGVTVVSLPGGELAVWGAVPDQRAALSRPAGS